MTWSIILNNEIANSMKKIFFFFLGVHFFSLGLIAQDKSLVNTSKSRYAKLRPVDMGNVQWTKGFWAEREQVLKVAVERKAGCCVTQAALQPPK